MKKTFALFLFILMPIYSHALVSFDNFFQKPNSDYFYTCSVGYNSCGSWLGEQYEILLNELQIISGEYSISIERYEYLNKLNNKRTVIIDNISQKYDDISFDIGEEEDKYSFNCKKYEDYLKVSSKKCLDYDNSEDFKINQINSLSVDLSSALDEYTLTSDHVDTIQSIGDNFIDLISSLQSDLILLNESLIKETVTSPNYIAEQNKIAEEKQLAEERRVAEEKQEALDEADRIANLPENLLIEAYGYYILIKELHEGDYLYITPRQMSEAKNQMRLIEDTLTKKVSLDTDSLWSFAVEQFEKNYSSSVEIFNLAYNSSADSFASIAALSLKNLAKKIGVNSSIKKDF